MQQTDKPVSVRISSAVVLEFPWVITAPSQLNSNEKEHT